MTSTDLTVYKPDGFLALTHDLAEIQELIEDTLQGEEISERDLPRITVPSGKASTYRWEVPTLGGGSEAVETVAGIVVFRRRNRAWWPTSIDENSGPKIPPSCSSPDARVGFGKQWATKNDPDPSGDPKQVVCKTCPHAQFGSGKDGRGQACSESAQIFLLRDTGFLPVVVSVPAMSLQPFKRYMLDLANNGVNFRKVVTMLGLEKAQNSGGTDFARITFRLAGQLDDEAATRALNYGKAFESTFEAVANQFIATDDDAVDEQAAAAEAAAEDDFAAARASNGASATTEHEPAATA